MSIISIKKYLTVENGVYFKALRVVFYMTKLVVTLFLVINEIDK